MRPSTAARPSLDRSRPLAARVPVGQRAQGSRSTGTWRCAAEAADPDFWLRLRAGPCAVSARDRARLSDRRRARADARSPARCPRSGVPLGWLGGGSDYTGFSSPVHTSRTVREPRAMPPLPRRPEPAAFPTLARGEYRYDFGDTVRLDSAHAHVHPWPQLSTASCVPAERATLCAVPTLGASSSSCRPGSSSTHGGPLRRGRLSRRPGWRSLEQRAFILAAGSRRTRCGSTFRKKAEAARQAGEPRRCPDRPVRAWPLRHGRV